MLTCQVWGCEWAMAQRSEDGKVWRTVWEAGMYGTGIAWEKNIEREVKGIFRVINMLMVFYFFRSYFCECKSTIRCKIFKSRIQIRKLLENYIWFKSSIKHPMLIQIQHIPHWKSLHFEKESAPHFISFSDNRGEGIRAIRPQSEITSIVEKYLPKCPPSALWPNKEVFPNRKRTRWSKGRKMEWDS